MQEDPIVLIPYEPGRGKEMSAAVCSSLIGFHSRTVIQEMAYQQGGFVARNVTRAPEFKEDMSSDERVQLMVEWFGSNFDDPANGLPYESREGGYQWIDGGPYDAQEELQDNFPDATEEEVEEAVQEIEAEGIVEWMSANAFEADYEPDDYDLYDDEPDSREMPPAFNPHMFNIVETTLFPQRRSHWSVHATFIPVKTNQDINRVAQAIIDAGGYQHKIDSFESLRQLVANLYGTQLIGREVGANPDIEASYEWIKTRESDADLFVDDGIIVHASPPEWLQLRKLFEVAAPVTGATLLSQDPAKWGGILLMYGGSLIFLRLVKNVGFVMDAAFEQWIKKIKKDL